MRRKIIRQGNHSYTLTLPVQWIRDQEILEGQEVDIETEGSDLHVRLPKERARLTNTITFDTTTFTSEYERTVRNLLNQSYRKGYDQIELRLRGKEDLETVSGIVKDSLLGFDIIKQSETSCTIASIAEPSSDTHDSIFNKLFFMINVEGREILEDLRKGIAANLSKRETAKNTMDTYTNFLRRIIIKDKIGGTKESYSHFVLVSRLSLIAHAYYYLYKLLHEKKKFKLTKTTLGLLEESLAMFEALRQAAFERDIEKTHHIAILKKKLLDGKLIEALQTSQGVDNAVLFHIGEAMRLMHMASTNIFGITNYPTITGESTDQNRRKVARNELS